MNLNKLNQIKYRLHGREKERKYFNFLDNVDACYDNRFKKVYPVSWSFVPIIDNLLLVISVIYTGKF